MFGISSEIALMWMPQDLTDDKSTLFQVMACHCQATVGHYLGSGDPQSMSTYGMSTYGVTMACQHMGSLCHNETHWGLTKTTSGRPHFLMDFLEKMLCIHQNCSNICHCSLFWILVNEIFEKQKLLFFSWLILAYEFFFIHHWTNNVFYVQMCERRWWYIFDCHKWQRHSVSLPQIRQG